MRRQTVNTRDAYARGWAAAAPPTKDVDACEARFLRRYGHHKVDAWHAGWADRVAGKAKWTTLPTTSAVCDTPLTSDETPRLPRSKRHMPSKRAAGKTVRSVAMPDTLWDRAGQRATDDGTDHSKVILDVLEGRAAPLTPTQVDDLQPA